MESNFGMPKLANRGAQIQISRLLIAFGNFEMDGDKRREKNAARHHTPTELNAAHKSPERTSGVKYHSSPVPNDSPSGV